MSTVPTRPQVPIGRQKDLPDPAPNGHERTPLRTPRPGDTVTGLCGTLNYAARTMLVAVNVTLRVGPDVTAAASADPFSGEVFWTDGERAHVRDGDGADEELAPSPASRLVNLNLDPPFPNAPGFKAVRLRRVPAPGGGATSSRCAAAAWRRRSRGRSCRSPHCR